MRYLESELPIELKLWEWFGNEITETLTLTVSNTIEWKTLGLYIHKMCTLSFAIISGYQHLDAFVYYVKLIC